MYFILNFDIFTIYLFIYTIFHYFIIQNIPNAPPPPILSIKDTY